MLRSVVMRRPPLSPDTHMDSHLRPTVTAYSISQVHVLSNQGVQLEPRELEREQGHEHGVGVDAACSRSASSTAFA